MPACQQRLGAGIEQLGLALPADAEVKLLAFLQLLVRWNQAYNLTAVRQPLEMVSRHLLDSLAILPYIGAGPLLDVGSGAGLPGIPLAIARPQLECSLLDSNGKKIRFIRQAALELGLANLTPLHMRLEQLHSSRGFAQITARAFSDLGQLCRLASPLLAEQGEILALKGTFDTIAAETQSMNPEYLSVKPLSVPFLSEQQRHLVIYRVAP
ncbi:MAG: 16S rRNA (guanine(527)-N(7))-methyltransferase RsmG [Gammaproteobacteria bacterium]|nr:16S rRNA (guanine(527)-N(7))-methyltransferase RsmG [Gammaproteobacteria bacterium]